MNTLASESGTLVDPAFARLANAAHAVLAVECDYKGEHGMDNQTVWFNVADFPSHEEIPKALEVIGAIFGTGYLVTQMLGEGENFLLVSKNQHNI